MIEALQNSEEFATGFWQSVENFLDPFLQNLDPSLFQNVILGVLMILIFIGEQIFTEVKTQEGRGEFLKMVIFYEILNVVRIPLLAIFALIIFAFLKDGLDGNYLENLFKFEIFCLLLIFAFFLLRPIFKFQEFFRGRRHKFEIVFLKSLNFSKILRFRNKTKSEKMVRAWNSFWSKETEYNEREFTEIFISHIDQAIKNKRLQLAIELAETYLQNIEKHGQFSIGFYILPKVLEWGEKLWEEEQIWLKNYQLRKESKKKKICFSFFQKLIEKKYKRGKSNDDAHFYDWRFFQQKFFPKIIEILLKDGHGQFELFEKFKNHIEKCEEKLNKIGRKEKKTKRDERYEKGYFDGLFSNFCPIFFENINDSPSGGDVWEHFPHEWKITTENSKKVVPWNFRNEFVRWARPRIFGNDAKGDFDQKLSEVTRGIFPSIHSSLFSAFLMLYFSGDVKSALEKSLNFCIFNNVISGSGEKSNEEINEMFRATKEDQKKTTIEIISKFFRDWPHRYKEDFLEDEISNWETFSEEKRKKIIKRVRINNLEKIKTKLESTEIKKICGEDKNKEFRRRVSLELIPGLLNSMLEDENI